MLAESEATEIGPHSGNPPLAHWPTSGFVTDTLGMAKTGTQKVGTYTRLADSKGRITLGEAFANRTLLVEEQDDRIILRLARIIPESEAWLYDNTAALAAVRKGLQQARAGELQDGPKVVVGKKIRKSK